MIKSGRFGAANVIFYERSRKHCWSLRKKIKTHNLAIDPVSAVSLNISRGGGGKRGALMILQLGGKGQRRWKNWMPPPENVLPRQRHFRATGRDKQEMLLRRSVVPDFVAHLFQKHRRNRIVFRLVYFLPSLFFSFFFSFRSLHNGAAVSRE